MNEKREGETRKRDRETRKERERQNMERKRESEHNRNTELGREMVKLRLKEEKAEIEATSEGN